LSRIEEDGRIWLRRQKLCIKSCRVIIIIIIITIITIITFRKYVSTIPGNHDVRKLQKTAILGTAHIIQKVLM
jgi:hypothetical protein